MSRTVRCVPRDPTTRPALVGDFRENVVNRAWSLPVRALVRLPIVKNRRVRNVSNASLLGDSYSLEHLIRLFPSAKASVRGDPDSGSARASKSSSDSCPSRNCGGPGSFEARRAAEKKKQGQRRSSRRFCDSAVVSSSFFFFDAALLLAFFCILWQPHCVHSVPLCEFRRGAWRQGDVPLGHLPPFCSMSLFNC